jgi:uncharacterized protein (TIGR00297 family)
VIRIENDRLAWQSKLILLLVVPWTAIHVVLQTQWWLAHEASVAITTLGISGIFGLIVWRMRAGTLGAAATGAAITASLMYSTTQMPYNTSWLHGGLMPLLAMFVLTYLATKIGKAKKEKIGTGEGKRGRTASQVAANLGMAAIAAQSMVWAVFRISPGPSILALLALAALAEAAADTVSSEIGQVFGGTPIMITTLKRVEPGADGGITLQGTFAGVLAAAIVSAVGFGLMGSRGFEFVACTAGITAAATVGLLFDSLVGATIERAGRLNNDAVNFLSTISAVLAAIPIVLILVNRYLEI